MRDGCLQELLDKAGPRAYKVLVFYDYTTIHPAASQGRDPDGRRDDRLMSTYKLVCDTYYDDWRCFLEHELPQSDLGHLVSPLLADGLSVRQIGTQEGQHS